ncbi:hypothetical protein [Spiroplasma sp. SV19]|uniref:hypothetical protein n=1 Tax=Spiroplasma sp. SV19 TaxID=2570468 RepID=UPI0024B63EA4|nr:hypothetical protein [Spiroplasma sp. SV19]WHQ36767.1 hypothetical protein E7Y35_02525 [Spiroplasma sp. SV19]
MKRILWTAIGLWISTIVFMIIGLGCLGAKAIMIPGGHTMNGYGILKSDVAPVFYNTTPINFILSKDWDNNLNDLVKNKDFYAKTDEEKILFDKMMNMYYCVRPGVIFAIILTPIMAISSTGLTSYYLIKIKKGSHN